MMTVAESAKQVRAALKAVGYTARMVSVRSESYSMGSSINVKIKSPLVNGAEVTRLAEAQERIRRCEMTGEVLNGGNRYVSVTKDWEMMRDLCAPVEAAIRAGASTLYGYRIDCSPIDCRAWPVNDESHAVRSTAAHGRLVAYDVKALAQALVSAMIDRGDGHLLVDGSPEPAKEVKPEVDPAYAWMISSEFLGA